MEVIKKVLGYLSFKKQDTAGNKNLKLMHGINRISLLMAIIGIVILVVKLTR